MKTLYILDYTAELIELTYELGALTRKHVVPAIIAAYVAIVVAVDFVKGLRGPTHSQMIQDLTREWQRINLMDPITNGSDVPELTQWLQTLSTEDLRVEHQFLCDSRQTGTRPVYKRPKMGYYTSIPKGYQP